MIVLISTDGGMQEIMECTKPPTLEELYKWIGCSLIEIVNVYWMGKSEQMIVDESGLLVEKPIVNPLATGLYGHMAVKNGHSLGVALSSPIAGNAVLLTGEHKLN